MGLSLDDDDADTLLRTDVEEYVLVVVMTAVEVLGSRMALRVATAKVEKEALTIIVRCEPSFMRRSTVQGEGRGS